MRLTPKAYAVLAYLIERHEQAVSKGTLLDTFWPDPAEASEAALTTCIREIRRKLQDSAATPRYLETVYPSRGAYPGVPRHEGGYRFIGPVTTLTPSAVHDSGDNHPTLVLPVSSDALPAPETLFGRERELAHLQRCVQRAWAGQRQVLFVTGEPGIGKTTLVQVFVQGLSADPQVWIGQGQCVEHYGDGEAYLPVLEALGRLGRQDASAPLVQILERYAPTWLAQLPGLVAPQDRAALLTSVQGVTRQRMLRELADALEILSAQHPFVLWLEDLQWSDVSTVQLLASLALRSGPARLVVLGTFRPVTIEHPLARMVHELQLKGCCQACPLPPLSETALSGYLCQRFAKVGAATPPTLARALYRRSEGNPLFMVQIADYLEAQTWWHATPRAPTEAAWEDLMHQIPTTLAHLIETQLARLSADEQQLLEVASVAGAEFSTAVVSAGGSWELETVEDGLAALAQRQHWVQPSGEVTTPDQHLATGYRFAHALYQEVLYQRLTGRRRVTLHRRIGDWQAQAYAGHTAEIAPELALHFTQGREFRRALGYQRQAAETALRRSAYQEAIAHLTRAMDVLRELAETPEMLQQELVLRTLLGSALSAAHGYGAADVQSAYAEAEALYQQAPDTPQLFPVVFGLWGFHLVRGTLRTAQTLGERLLHLAQRSRDTALQVLAYGAMGLTMFHRGVFGVARTYLEQSLALYEPQRHSQLVLQYGQDPWVACEATRAQALWFLGYPEQALQASYAALQRARDLAHPFSLAFAFSGVMTVHHLRRESEAAQKHAETSLTLCHEQGFPFWETSARIFLGWAIAEQGPLEAGLPHIQQGLHARSAIGAELAIPMFLGALAYANLPHASTALPVLHEALRLIAANGEQRFGAELHRLYALALVPSLQTPLAMPARRPAGEALVAAEAALQTARALAQQQEARSMELRATMTLSRLWQMQGQGPAARQMLASVYDGFREGFDTADLQEAQALLALLA